MSKETKKDADDSARSSSYRYKAVRKKGAKSIKNWSDCPEVKRLQELYIESGMTLNDLMEHMNVDRSTFYRWIIHPTVPMPVTQFAKVAKVLGYDIELKRSAKKVH